MIFLSTHQPSNENSQQVTKKGQRTQHATQVNLRFAGVATTLRRSVGCFLFDEAAVYEPRPIQMQVKVMVETR